ncbi:MAG TPA: glycosyltransferase [Candidatus Cybelea sp.]|nr:glycosyltransferase [Candidatus Cybelea sp.]
MPARVPHLLHIFSTFAMGGPQVRFAWLANRFGRKFRHSIIALDGNDACRGRLDGDLDLEILPTRVSKERPLTNWIEIARQIANVAPDQLITYNWGAIEWALVNRVIDHRAHIHCEDGFGPDEIDAQKWRRVFIRRLALSGRSLVVVPSRTLESIARDVWRLRPGQILYVPNGIDCTAFDQAAPRRALPGLERHDGLVVGTVATLRAEKNIVRLMRAFQAARSGDARLVIAGEGPERARLEAAAAAAGLKDSVIFLGHVPNPAEVLEHFDIFALSSDTEQMPLSVLEAMAAGLPVAAVNVGDLAHMLSPENAALLAPRGDEAGLADLLRRLLDEEPLRTRLGRSNRMNAEQRFAESAMLASYERIFSGAAALNAA